MQNRGKVFLACDILQTVLRGYQEALLIAVASTPGSPQAFRGACYSADCGQLGKKGIAAPFALRPDLSSVMPDNALRNGQSQP